MKFMETHDHDLLIRLDEKFDSMIEKVDKLTDDHEKRLRSIEKYIWKAIGAIAVVEIGLTIFSLYIQFKK